MKHSISWITLRVWGYLKKFVSIYILKPLRPFKVLPPAVPELSVETTNLCNSKCVFCANPVMKRSKMPLSMELFTKAIDEFAAMGGMTIDFNVTIGDPLLDKSLLERARYVKRYPQFNTNGFVTTLQWLHTYDLNEFFEAGFTWINVSTVLTGRESYREFFGVDKYDQMLENLVRLLEEDKKRNWPINVRVDIKPTPESAEVLFTHPDYQKVRASVRDPDLLDRSVGNRSYFVDDWIGAVKLPSYLKKRPLFPRNRHPCKLLYKGLMVYSNGNVGACSCRDFEASSELILGNVANNSLFDLWNGEKISKLRSNWLKRNEVPKICSSCRHYQY